MMKAQILFVLLIGVILGGCKMSLAQIKAITEDGRTVLLYDNGVWHSIDEIVIHQEPFVLPGPYFKGKLAFGKKITPSTFSLLKVSPDNYWEDSLWFRDNNIKLPEYEVPNSFRYVIGNIPPQVPRSYREVMLIRAFYSEDYNFLIYGVDFSSGRYLIITDRNFDKVLHVLDFKNYMLSPDYVKSDLMFVVQEIRWATIENDVLYFSHGHRTYASSSKNMNAYISAFDLKEQKIIWHSKPLVCNSYNFELYKDMIICGYGFTKEKDYLYVLNKFTGEIIHKQPLRSGPDYVVRKNDSLYVRTYDTNYFFKIK